MSRADPAGGHRQQADIVCNDCGAVIRSVAAADADKVLAEMPRPRSPNLGKVPLWIVGTDSAKSTIYGRLKIGEPGPGYAHFPAQRSPDYFEQLLSEVLITTYSHGKPVRTWRRKQGVRAEALDCRVYAYAALRALISMGLNLDADAERIAAMGAGVAAERPSSPRVTRSRWMDGVL